MNLLWWLIWKIGQSTSCLFLPSCGAFSASFILLLNSRRVSSISSKPAGGGFWLRPVRIGGIFAACIDFSIFLVMNCSLLWISKHQMRTSEYDSKAIILLESAAKCRWWLCTLSSGPFKSGGRWNNSVRRISATRYRLMSTIELQLILSLVRRIKLVELSNKPINNQHIISLPFVNSFWEPILINPEKLIKWTANRNSTSAVSLRTIAKS